MRLCLTLALVLCAGPSFALDPKLAESLKELDPTTRLIQVCDLESMDRIDHDSSSLHPDRVMVDALGQPRITDDDTVSGDGAVLRSRGKWFHFSFKCAATPDHLSVKSFSYKLGNEIPREQWEKLGLFD